MLKLIWLLISLGGVMIYFLVKKRYQVEVATISKKDTNLRWLIALGLWVLDIIPKEWGHQKTDYVILQLYGRQEYTKRIRLFYAQRITWFVLCIFLANIFAFCIVLKQQLNVEVTSLERPSFEDGDLEHKLYYDVIIADQLTSNSIDFKIPRSSPTEKELQQEFLRIEQELPNQIIGTNQSLLEVREPLNLIKNIPSSGFEIKWKSGNEGLLLNNGQIKNDDLNGEGEEVLLTATLSYGEQEFQANYQVYIVGKQYTEQEKLALVRSELVTLLSRDNLNLTNEPNIILPSEFTNYQAKIKWYPNKKQISPIIVILMGVVCGMLLQLLKKKELKLLAKRREEELRMAFPSWINKFTLLMNAGMTFSKAFEKIAEDYSLVKQQSGKINPLYEEMLISLEDIRKGVPEIKAIESLGQRSRIPEMLRFTSAVLQNIKKGGQLLLIVLQQQAKEALLLREDLAKKKGEKASTRLIFPMAIMLLAIMLIVMTPALLSLNI